MSESQSSALHPSPSFSNTSTPIKSASSSSEAYILSIASLPTFYAASASAPSNAIDLFDKTTLLGVQTLPGHEAGTTSLRAVETIANIARPCLVSSGLDGSIKVWDQRTNSYSIKMTNLGQARGLLCCDVSQDGLTVAGGTQLQGEDAHIVYWDPRQPAAPLRTHSSTHSDDVTVLRFSPDSPNVLMPAGYIPLRGAKIWGHSDMETFSTWSDELDLLQSQDIRGPSLHNHAQYEWLTDYLITCHSSATSPDLKVFVGSNQGDFALLTNSDLSTPAAPWSLCNTWANGHAGIVRSLLWDEQNEVIVTGGEDGKINVWAYPSDSAMDVDSSPSASKKRDKRDMDWEDEHGRKTRETMNLRGLISL
ncbi:WD40 repeat-like protein [Mycena venus]|uniref:WD40 repeat-like protein n=1 Tax=Mycena venus TaxID=2733690 RepID=A0A8H6WY30_9AGAR|nr:WD40 repeat-like protein [Mycena venus]